MKLFSCLNCGMMFKVPFEYAEILEVKPNEKELFWHSECPFCGSLMYKIINVEVEKITV